MYNVRMTTPRFEWEPRKANANLKSMGLHLKRQSQYFTMIMRNYLMILITLMKKRDLFY